MWNEESIRSDGLTPLQRRRVLDSLKMRTFLDRASAGFDFRGGDILAVTWFGQKQETVGFILFRANASTHAGETFPGTVTFIRGDAVAVMPILSTPDGAEWTVVTRQPRIATGRDDYPEIPAGMVDEGVFHSTAIRELEEEVGADLGISEQDLVSIAEFQPSPGGCDETVKIYYARRDVSQALVDSLRGRQSGLAAEGERIRVEVIALDSLPEVACGDSKSLIAYYGYMASRGLVARPIPSINTPMAQSPAGHAP